MVEVIEYDADAIAYFLKWLLVAAAMATMSVTAYAQSPARLDWDSSASVSANTPAELDAPGETPQLSGSIAPVSADTPFEEELEEQVILAEAAESPAPSEDACDGCSDCWFQSFLSSCFTPLNCKRPGELTFKPGLRLHMTTISSSGVFA